MLCTQETLLTTRGQAMHSSGALGWTGVGFFLLQLLSDSFGVTSRDSLPTGFRQQKQLLS